jgi:hypothetical protein
MLLRNFATKLPFFNAGRTGGGIGPKYLYALFSSAPNQPADSLSGSSSGESSAGNKDKTVRRALKADLSKLTPQNVHEAVSLLRQTTWAKFDETVEISVNLGVDPRKPNQSIKVTRVVWKLDIELFTSFI